MWLEKAQHLEFDAGGEEGTCSSLEISRGGIKSAFLQGAEGPWHEHPCGIEVTTELTCLAWQSLGALISLEAASGVAPGSGTVSGECRRVLTSSGC